MNRTNNIYFEVNIYLFVAARETFRGRFGSHSVEVLKSWHCLCSSQWSSCLVIAGCTFSLRKMNKKAKQVLARLKHRPLFGWNGFWMTRGSPWTQNRPKHRSFFCCMYLGHYGTSFLPRKIVFLGGGLRRTCLELQKVRNPPEKILEPVHLWLSLYVYLGHYYELFSSGT